MKPRFFYNLFTAICAIATGISIGSTLMSSLGIRSLGAIFILLYWLATISLLISIAAASIATVFWNKIRRQEKVTVQS